MQKELQILHLEDNQDDAVITQWTLRKAGLTFSIRVVDSEKEFRKALLDSPPDVVISDHSLPGFISLEAYKILRELLPGTPFILLTGSVSEQFAVDCLLAGMDDYILKSNLIRLPSSINRVISKKQLSDEKETIEKLHRQLKETMRALETRNREVMDSITYARRIQNAILPNDVLFTQDFPNGFAIYEPRDVVSGDLYWLSTVIRDSGKKLRYAAAIDCTGHGVPGAFMSMLVSSLLNETPKREMKSPGKMLAYLNRKLPQALNKNNKGRISDGLDVGLCVIDMDNLCVTYSGANRPLWIIRNLENKPHVFEFPPTKASIGLDTNPDQEFGDMDISVQPGDRLYLFTDGITDQFGGPLGKKFGRKNLKQLLLDTAHLSIEEQKAQVLACFLNWKGELEQVDDVLLLGLQVTPDQK